MSGDAESRGPGPGRGGVAGGLLGGWTELDAEADARTASPAQREASRVQGRLLLRTARRIWPSPVLDGLAEAVPEGAHHPIALGAAAGAAGCAPEEAALAAAYTSVTGPATAAVRLLGLDPVAVHRLLADLAPDLERTASTATAAVTPGLEQTVSTVIAPGLERAATAPSAHTADPPRPRPPPPPRGRSFPPTRRPRWTCSPSGTCAPDSGCSSPDPPLRPPRLDSRKDGASWAPATRTTTTPRTRTAARCGWASAGPSAAARPR
nr:hypothetical protein GCM10020093_106100 [Planobispora longispora]